MSIAFYDQHADAYFSNTVHADVSALRARFLEHVRPEGSILDAGCGSGRDARAFAEAGYKVIAFDGSAVMARLAASFTGLPVRHLTFDQMDWRESFDGVWASASLLHVPRPELPATFCKFAAALRPGGAWYLSIKLGDATRSVDGRTFTDVTEVELTSLLGRTGLTTSDIWLSDDVRPGRADRWVNAIAVKGDAALSVEYLTG
jgi:SAM-dependent methyltransferase